MLKSIIFRPKVEFIEKINKIYIMNLKDVGKDEEQVIHQYNIAVYY